MADQNGVILFLVISVIALWGIVMVLAAVYLAAFLKRRGQLKAVVLDGEGEVRDAYELGRQRELLIGKSTPANLVNIDFSDSAYAGSIEEEQAPRGQRAWWGCGKRAGRRFTSCEGIFLTAYRRAILYTYLMRKSSSGKSVGGFIRRIL